MKNAYWLIVCQPYIKPIHYHKINAMQDSKKDKGEHPGKEKGKINTAISTTYTQSDKDVMPTDDKRSRDENKAANEPGLNEARTDNKNQDRGD